MENSDLLESLRSPAFTDIEPGGDSIAARTIQRLNTTLAGPSAGKAIRDVVAAGEAASKDDDRLLWSHWCTLVSLLRPPLNSGRLLRRLWEIGVAALARHQDAAAVLLVDLVNTHNFYPLPSELDKLGPLLSRNSLYLLDMRAKIATKQAFLGELSRMLSSYRGDEFQLQMRLQVFYEIYPADVTAILQNSGISQWYEGVRKWMTKAGLYHRKTAYLGTDRLGLSTSPFFWPTRSRSFRDQHALAVANAR